MRHGSEQHPRLVDEVRAQVEQYPSPVIGRELLSPCAGSAAWPPPLETRTSDISELVESKSIDALPLGNRRRILPQFFGPER